MVKELSIAQATLADVEILLHQRRAMFEEMGFSDARALEAMVISSREFLQSAVPKGSFVAWLAKDSEGKIVGGGGVLVTAAPASPNETYCRRASILNLYVDREYRRRGIARALMSTILEWCRDAGFRRVSLHASDEGRHLYESLGFGPTNEMRLTL